MTSRGRAPRDPGTQRADKSPEGKPFQPPPSPREPWKFFSGIWEFLQYFPVAAIENHKQRRHFRAAGCWFCACLLPVVILIGLWALPVPLFGDLGSGLRDVAYSYFGVRPPIADFYPNPSLSPRFEIIDPITGKHTPATSPMICYTGEQISVSFELKERAYVLLFGWDGTAPYHLSRSPLETVSRGIGMYDDIVQLDSNPNGDPLQETIYVIWSALPFDYKKSIEPKLLQGPGGSRGGSAIGATLPLGHAIEQESFVCKHVN